mmetsp:Transcript_11472/g.19407  ORF Transcript_11472/g.19407 Transcript_11472/m.19407 type:complete len:160 (+) Transcript_11472:466-945(+)|eukprot:CAMPEP_0168608868 /NCGR_PEP_ID=MMETSP0449_2-20121227/884_1 /TAXON_ID=1082188 /ORGANISM="Strombidium rassoulzadegani, Strain ras09" /LENGTH=159 /DNA_ID=CAMNT_0008648937 /DNA_START=401 /DNA_END=880 /DNA_ORIENTATION=-
MKKEAEEEMDEEILKEIEASKRTKKDFLRFKNSQAKEVGLAAVPGKLSSDTLKMQIAEEESNQISAQPNSDHSFVSVQKQIKNSDNLKVKSKFKGRDKGELVNLPETKMDTKITGVMSAYSSQTPLEQRDSPPTNPQINKVILDLMSYKQTELAKILWA